MHRHNESSLAVRVRGASARLGRADVGGALAPPARVDLLRSGFVGHRAPPPGLEGSLRAFAARAKTSACAWPSPAQPGAVRRGRRRLGPRQPLMWKTKANFVPPASDRRSIVPRAPR